jgi:hypothetical protein
VTRAQTEGVVSMHSHDMNNAGTEYTDVERLLVDRIRCDTQIGLSLIFIYAYFTICLLYPYYVHIVTVYMHTGHFWSLSDKHKHVETETLKCINTECSQPPTRILSQIFGSQIEWGWEHS